MTGLQIPLSVSSNVLTFWVIYYLSQCLDPYTNFPAWFITMLFIEEALPGVCHVLIFIQKRISSRLQSAEELFKKVTHSAYMLFFYLLKTAPCWDICWKKKSTLFNICASLKHKGFIVRSAGEAEMTLCFRRFKTQGLDSAGTGALVMVGGERESMTLSWKDYIATYWWSNGTTRD